MRGKVGQGGAKRFGDVLRNLLKAKRFYHKGRFGLLGEAWSEIAGPELASRTRVGSYEHGRLTVEVDSSVVMHELAGFMKHLLLEQLQQRPAGRDVAELRFRLGRGFTGREED